MSLQAPLDVVGEVQAVLGDESVRLTAMKSTIAVDMPHLRTGLVALRGTGGRRQRVRMISRVSAALKFTGLDLQFRVAGRTIAMLGGDARPGLLSRLLGLGPLEFRLSGVMSLMRTFWR